MAYMSNELGQGGQKIWNSSQSIVTIKMNYLHSEYIAKLAVISGQYS